MFFRLPVTQALGHFRLYGPSQAVLRVRVDLRSCLGSRPSLLASVWQDYCIYLSIYLHLLHIIYVFIYIYTHAYIYICIYIYTYIYVYIHMYIYTCACTCTFSPACPPPQESVEIALKSCTCFSICLIVGALISAASPHKAKHTPSASASGTPRSCWGSTKTASRPCTSDTIRIDYLPPGFTNHDLLCRMLCSGRLSLGMKLHSKNAVTATTALEFQVRHVRTSSC